MTDTAHRTPVDWSALPEPLLLAVLQQLAVADILSVCRTCVSWAAIARDDYLWRQLFRRDFRVAAHIALKPGTPRPDSLRAPHGGRLRCVL